MILPTLRNKFSDYLQERNLTNSGKASSYVRALDLLSEMLASSPMGFSDCVDIWSTSSISRLQELYQLVRECDLRKQALGIYLTFHQAIFEMDIARLRFEVFSISSSTTSTRKSCLKSIAATRAARMSLRRN